MLIVAHLSLRKITLALSHLHLESIPMLKLHLHYHISNTLLVHTFGYAITTCCNFYTCSCIIFKSGYNGGWCRKRDENGLILFYNTSNWREERKKVKLVREYCQGFELEKSRDGIFKNNFIPGAGQADLNLNLDLL